MLVLLTITSHQVMAFMLMDRESCVQVEEEECGICHTIYMEECKMKMVEEMIPTKVTMCKNVTRYENKCKKVMKHKMVEEKRPICKVMMMTKNHTKCKHQRASKVCKKVMKCSLGMMKMAKTYPTMECEDIAIGEEEMCVDMVKLKKEEHMAKYCSYVPKTVCRDRVGVQCRRVSKKMCQYVDGQGYGGLHGDGQGYTRLHVDEDI